MFLKIVCPIRRRFAIVYPSSCESKLPGYTVGKIKVMAPSCSCVEDLEKSVRNKDKKEKMLFLEE